MIETRKVERHFSKLAYKFDRLYALDEIGPMRRCFNTAFRPDVYERLELTLDHIKKCGVTSVLNVGCGSGRYEKACLHGHIVRRIVGVDLSPVMLSLARSCMEHLGRGESAVEFVCGDFMEFTTAERFDCVLATGVFDYVQAPAALLKHMKSFAKHSVVATFPSISWYRTPIRKLRYLAMRCPLHVYRRSDIHEFAAAAGIQTYSIRKIAGAGADYYVKFFV